MPGPRLIDLGNPVADHPLNVGLVAWWLGLPNTSGGGTLFDLVRQPGCDGTITNGPTWVPGPGLFGGLTLSSGSSQYVGGTLPTFNLPLTLAVWVRVTTTQTDKRILTVNPVGSVSHVESLAFDSSGRLYAQSYNGVTNRAVIGTAPAAGSWVRAAAVLTASAGTLYADGVQVAQTSTAITGAALTGFQIGRNDWTPGEYLSGSVAAPAVWSYALSAADIALDYDQSLRGHPDTLRRYTPRAWVFGGTAPAGGFQAAWARGANVLIGAGRV